MDRPTVVFIVGTRPDAIKAAPVVQEFRRHESVSTVLVSTGQHREMLAQALGAFGLVADVDLDVMVHGQTLAGLTSRILDGLDPELARLNPAIVLAQGDTTTTFVACLASFYRQVPFAHIEAGLRTDAADHVRGPAGILGCWHPDAVSGLAAVRATTKPLTSPRTAEFLSAPING